ncbi:MAG: hypothetical protein ABSE07_02305 [Methanoregula sp.]|jgi:hypothetical protein
MVNHYNTMHHIKPVKFLLQCLAANLAYIAFLILFKPIEPSFILLTNAKM